MKVGWANYLESFWSYFVFIEILLNLLKPSYFNFGHFPLQIWETPIFHFVHSFIHLFKKGKTLKLWISNLSFKCDWEVYFNNIISLPKLFLSQCLLQIQSYSSFEEIIELIKEYGTSIISSSIRHRFRRTLKLKFLYIFSKIEVSPISVMKIVLKNLLKKCNCWIIIWLNLNLCLKLMKTFLLKVHLSFDWSHILQHWSNMFAIGPFT